MRQNRTLIQLAVIFETIDEFVDRKFITQGCRTLIEGRIVGDTGAAEVI
tara:strand:- start:114 stop:260 length:147 start_codon:yes stop_codon:yes gene_type:complete